jgi:pimeloyl-ACP methyl ester carboxylesterase
VRIAFLHAWPLDEQMWQPQAAAVAEAGFDFVAPRLYGRGPVIDAWATQILAEITGPFVAVGASMGGYLALALARRSPERVPGMVLAGSRADADSPERRRDRDDLIAELQSAGIPLGLETDVPPEELAVAQEAIRERPDASGTVAAFGGPLLVCVGDRDELLSTDEARAIADSALRGSLEVFERAGHLVSVEQPARFNVVLMEFLAQWT